MKTKDDIAYKYLIAFILGMFLFLLYFLQVGVCMSIAKEKNHITYNNSAFTCAINPFKYR